MNSKNNINNKKNILKQIFAEILSINVSKINDNFSTKNNKECDSMSQVRIIIEVEKKFKIKIKFQDVEKIRTFKAFYQFLDSSI